MGYQNVDIPIGFSIFTPTFKNIGNTSIDLKSIVPATPSGAKLSLDSGAVYALILDDKGNYGTPVVWYGAKGGWSSDNGVSIIDDNTVVIGNGVGFAVYNGLKMKDGVESTARGSTESKAMFQVSGEVDLTCENAVPVGFSINGNSTPVPVDIADIVPKTPSGETLALDSGAIYLLILDDKGNYGTPIVWYGTKGGWSTDNGMTILAKDSVVLAPGAGIAVYNGLKMKGGVESTARGSTESPAILKLPKPVAAPTAE